MGILILAVSDRNTMRCQLSYKALGGIGRGGGGLVVVQHFSNWCFLLLLPTFIIIWMLLPPQYVDVVNGMAAFVLLSKM